MPDWKLNSAFDNYVESWHQGVVLVFTLCQWKVWGTKIGLCLGHKLTLVTGIVISISKQEYMFKALFVAVRVSERVFLIYLLIDLYFFFGVGGGNVDARASVPLRSYATCKSKRYEDSNGSKLPAGHRRWMLYQLVRCIFHILFIPSNMGTVVVMILWYLNLKTTCAISAYHH